MRVFIAGIVATIVLLGGLVWYWESTTPTSTSGVVEIGDNQVRLPAGELFVLTHTVGKVTQVWEITYNGDRTVTLRDDTGWPFGNVVTGTLCGVGCMTDIDMGWGNHFYVSALPNGGASVTWPSGWSWRR